MSRKDDSGGPKRAKKSRTDGPAPEQARPGEDADYDVGYGKPPAATRFVKGQSGNPRGRPRKRKPKPPPPSFSDGLSEQFLKEEAYRQVTLRENGKPVELTMTQAVIRSLGMEAVKGKRLSQKLYLEIVGKAEDEHIRNKLHRYFRLENHKRTGEKLVAECERRGIPYPIEHLPHPEDIVLKPRTYEVAINGPETPDDIHFYEHAAELRDFCLLQSSHNDKFWKGRPSKDPAESFNGFLVLAQLLDDFLPRRYRWQDDAELSLLFEYRALNRRDRERRIAHELARLKETEPAMLYLTPEIRSQLEKLLDQGKK